MRCSFDLVIIDTGAGISENVIYFNRMADRIVIVTTPEPHAMTDAYAMIKVLALEHGRRNLNLVINMARSENEALKVSSRLTEVSEKFLSTRVNYIGHVPFDPQVQLSVGARQAVTEKSIRTMAGQSWNEVSQRILYDMQPGISDSSEQWVWKELLSEDSLKVSSYV